VDWKPQRQAVAMMTDVLVRGFLRQPDEED
jgi:hypothetical protein